jgi:hypothetical protein
MQVTLFGFTFLAVTILTLISRRRWFVAIFPLAAVLQSPAVAVFELANQPHGVSPSLAWGTSLIVLAVADFRSSDNRMSLRSTRNCVALKLWCVFWVFACITALFLPVIFSGMKVYLLVNKAGDLIVPSSLTLTLSNFVQIANTLFIFALFLLIAEQAVRHTAGAVLQVFFGGLVLALVVSFAIGLQHRLVVLGVVEYWSEFWVPNPTYNQTFGPTKVGGELSARASLPFLEPSYASAWYAPVAVGCWLAVVCAGVRAWKFAIGGSLALAGLLSSAGNTGLIALALSLPILITGLVLTGGALFAVRWWRERDAQTGQLTCLRPAFRAVASMVLFIGIGVSVTQTMSPSMRGLAEGTLAQMKLRVADVTTALPVGVEVGRRASNELGWRVLLQTHGLGVGMGSNRTSGYFHALLSNVGVIGAALFLVSFVVTVASACRRVWALRSAPESEKRFQFLIGVFALGALLCATVAVAGGIPDQNWPIWWAFIALVFTVGLLPESPALTRGTRLGPWLSNRSFS